MGSPGPAAAVAHLAARAAAPGAARRLPRPPPLPLAITLLLLSGAASAYGLGLDQALGEHTPPTLLARTYTVNTTGLMVVQGIGFAAAGALGSMVSAGTAIAVAGLLGVLGVTALRQQRPTAKPNNAGGAAPCPVPAKTANE